MAKVSIAEAARRAGIARSTMYEKYINPGKITVEDAETDGRKHKVIDLAELFRVFGDNVSVSGVRGGQGGTSSDGSRTLLDVSETGRRTASDGQELAAKTALLEQEVKFLREQLNTERGHIETLKQAMRLLEDKRPPVADQEGLAEELLRSQAEAARLAQDLETERAKGFFARLFGR